MRQSVSADDSAAEPPERAIARYKKSIEMNPDNANGKRMLERLRKN